MPATVPPAPVGQQVTASPNFRKVYVEPTGTKLLAATGAESRRGLGTIFSLTPGTPPFSLTAKAGADLQSLKVAPAPPAAALYVYGPIETGFGILKHVDLTATPPVITPVPDAAWVPTNGFFFGSNGKQVLFFADARSRRDGIVTGDLFWWSGSGTPVKVGTSASPGTLVFSRDRTLAIVGVNVRSAIADLIAIDLATGLPIFVGQGAVVLASHYGTGVNALTGSAERAFSISDDGAAVAYADEHDAVFLWTRAAGKASQLTGEDEHGHLPTLHLDAGGPTVAFLGGEHFDELHLRRPDQAPAMIGNVGNVALPPVFAPDGRTLFALRQLSRRGISARYGDVIGDIWATPLPGGKPVKIAQAAAWRSLSFSPGVDGATGVSLVADLADGTGTPTMAGAGKLFTGVSGGQPLTVQARGVHPDDVHVLPKTGGLAYIANVSAGGGKGTAFVQWTPGAPLQRLTDEAVPGSMFTTGDAPALSLPGDLVLVRAEPEPTTVDEGTFRPATLIAGIGPTYGPRRLQRSVIDAVLSPEGRALAVVVSPDATQSGLWLTSLAP